MVTGYIGQAVLFNASLQQTIRTSYISLYNVSFTVDVWIKLTAYPTSGADSHIVGLCPSGSTSRCLQILIRSQKPYFGFYSNDLGGAATISLNQWIHLAFVYDVIKRTQTIYVNGVQDSQRTNVSPLVVSSGNFTIATNENIATSTGYFQVKLGKSIVIKKN